MSSAEQDQVLRERDLEFFGQVTASISHELNNCIAIIDQTAGLLEDLAATRETQAVPHDKLQRIIDTIRRQTERGAVIVRRLNAFAHSMEVADREIGLDDLVQRVVALAQRTADRRRVHLECSSTTVPVSVPGNLFRMLQAVFVAIRAIVTIVPEDTRVVVTGGTDDGVPWIAVESEPVESPPELDLLHLEPLMHQLGGELYAGASDNRMAVRLLFAK